MKKAPRLKREFFRMPTVTVAENLIGKVLVFQGRRGVIVETEAYFGDDPASHGAVGKTKRNFVMFGRAGVSYVYMIYGIHFCLNISTETEGFPAAVLIRGLEMLDEEEGVELNGPGKICRHLGIDRRYNDLDICRSKELYIEDPGTNILVEATKRIGITKNVDKMWRFVKKVR